MFFAQNTALSWLVYKVATGIPLYIRKGYPLYRELYMGDLNAISWPATKHNTTEQQDQSPIPLGQVTGRPGRSLY